MANNSVHIVDQQANIVAFHIMILRYDTIFTCDQAGPIQQNNSHTSTQFSSN